MAKRRKYRSPNSYARRAPSRQPYDTVLIVCEGEKTEPNYFTGLIKAHSLSSTNVAITNAPGTDPMSVVGYAETIMAQMPYDRVFCVFDRDGHANFENAIRRIADQNVGAPGLGKQLRQNRVLKYGFSYITSIPRHQLCERAADPPATWQKIGSNNSSATIQKATKAFMDWSRI